MKIVKVNEPVVKESQVEMGLVKLPAGFGCEELWYGETPVTEAQWAEVMGGGVRHTRYPKVNVSFEEAQEFCRKLSEMSGMEFRLPTEVEQCRGFGVEPEELEKFAVFDRSEICAVRTKLPNEFGLYDVRGLVWEWVTSEEKGGRVVQGGSWDLVGFLCRSSFRISYSPGFRNLDLGFRVVVGAGSEDC